MVAVDFGVTYSGLGGLGVLGVLGAYLLHKYVQAFSKTRREALMMRICVAHLYDVCSVRRA
jgi:hypothetical protein